MGRPKGSKTKLKKRNDIKLYESTFKRWNTFRATLDKSHDDLASYLLDFHAKHFEDATENIPPLTPIRSANPGKQKQLSSSTPHGSVNKSAGSSSSGQSSESKIRLSRLQLSSPGTSTDGTKHTLASVKEDEIMNFPSFSASTDRIFRIFCRVVHIAAVNVVVVMHTLTVVLQCPCLPN